MLSVMPAHLAHLVAHFHLTRAAHWSVVISAATAVVSVLAPAARMLARLARALVLVAVLLTAVVVLATFAGV